MMCQRIALARLVVARVVCAARRALASPASPVSLAVLKKMKVTELRELLSAQGLGTAGLKAELVERLAAVGKSGSSPASNEAAVDDAVARGVSVIETPAMQVATRGRRVRAIHEAGMSLLSVEFPKSRGDAPPMVRAPPSTDAEIAAALEQTDDDFLGTVSAAAPSSSEPVANLAATLAIDSASDAGGNDAPESLASKPVVRARRGAQTLAQMLAQEEAAEEALEKQMRDRQAQRAAARAQRDPSAPAGAATIMTTPNIDASSASAAREARAFEAQLTSVAARLAPKPLPKAVWKRFAPSAPGEVGVHEVLRTLERQRAASISIYEVRGRSPLTDVTIVCTGSSTNHVRAIADAVARTARAATAPARAPRGGGTFDVQGRESDDWMLVDLQQAAVVHVFTAEGRTQYAYVEDRAVVDSDESIVPVTDAGDFAVPDVDDTEAADEASTAEASAVLSRAPSSSGARFVHNAKALSAGERVQLRKEIDAAAAKYRAQRAVSLVAPSPSPAKRAAKSASLVKSKQPDSTASKAVDKASATDPNVRFKRLRTKATPSTSLPPLDDQAAAEQRRNAALAAMLKL